MHYFVILDDDISHINSTIKRLEVIIKKNQLNAVIELNTTDPREVMEYSINNSARNNIYLLDVDVQNKVNGIDVAGIIRKQEAKAYIIFISAYPEYVMPSLKTKIFDYLIKPVTVEILETCIVSVMEDTARINEDMNKDYQYLSIKSGFEMYHIRLDEIIYFEKFGHQLVIHTVTGQIQSTESLENLELKLDRTKYFRCHRSFIVNLSYISRIDYPDSMVYFKNGDSCLVSKRSKKEMKLLCSSLL